VETESLLSMLVGGIAFETPTDLAGAAVAAKAKFTLFDSRTLAMKPRDTVIQPVIMKFAQSVRGLTVGAPLDFRGITAGEVRRIDLEYDPVNVRFLIVVEANIYPERLRSRYRDPARSALPELTPAQRIQRFVEHGFRAQLRSANLITGQQYVALDFFPKAPHANAPVRDGVPELPTVAGGFGELQESLQNLASKLEKVPFDKLGDDLHNALKSLDATLKKADALFGQIQTDVAPELRATLEQARKTLGSAERILGSDSPLQGDLRDSLLEVTKAPRNSCARSPITSSAIRVPAARQTIGRDEEMRTIAIVLAMLATACSLGGAVKENYYVLSGPEGAAPADSPGALAIYVGPVAVPESVDRSAIVLQSSANQVDLSDEHRWAEPVKTAIPRVIAENLAC
jgi:paraquat-inducible protein B